MEDQTKSIAITEKFIPDVLKDIEDFREELKGFSAAITGNSEGLRGLLDSEIDQYTPQGAGGPCSGIDAANLVISNGMVVTVACLGFEVYCDGKTSSHIYKRKTSIIADDRMTGVAVAIRTPIEVEIIAESKSPISLADGSWWARLMEVN